MADFFIQQLSEAGRVLQEPVPGRDHAARLSGKDFIAASYRAWKDLHLKAIGEIITIDTIEEKNKERPIDPRFVAYLLHIRQAWRRVNDGIVWYLCGGHRHFVKRLCFYRQRGRLDASNPDHALHELQTFNSEPLTIALWNDATTCVDIGDITKCDAATGELSFLELKSGKVNAAILALIGRPPTSDSLGQSDIFAEHYGDAGVKQLERVLRQEQRNRQALRLIRDEKGVDPVLGEEIEIQELRTPVEYYDQELSEVFRTALRTGSASTLVDGCLWLYVDATPNLTSHQIQQRFADTVIRKNPSLKDHVRWAFNGRDAGRAVPLRDALYHPVAKPPFLRGLDPETVAAATCGNLRHGVWLYLDWQKFGCLCEAAGAAFSWSSGKEARRNRAEPLMMRAETVNGRVPLVTVGEFKRGVTGANMVELMFDGRRPRSLAAAIVESAHLSEETARRRKGT